MQRRILLRTLLLTIVVCAFGAVDAVVKGHHGGTRNAIGNVSAPWALLPFVSAVFLMPRRFYLGALVGAAATTTALASYSVTRLVRDSDMGSHFRGANTIVIASLGNRWFLLGILGGAVLGAAGSWLAVRREWAVIAAVVALALVLEPVARIAWALGKGETFGTLVPSPAVWIVEITGGCAVGLGFWLRELRNRTALNL